MRRFLAWKKQCAVLVMSAATGIPIAAQTFTIAHSFTGPEGASPYAGLVQGLDNNLYGTTTYGGAYGLGNVFKMDPSAKVTSLYDFCAQSNCIDGQYPDSTLVMGPDGAFYGNTQNGGLYNFGSVFKVSTAGVLTTLHSFNITDGVNPAGSLLLASDGNFYGTANAAGACMTEGAGCGTIFRISPNGDFATIYNFCLQTGCPDGEFPVGGLTEGSDGNFYGTTNAGGNSICPGGGCGTIYKITPGGTLTTLHRFNNTDGANPTPSLVEIRKGLFYGTTSSGGPNRDGTVFSITANGFLKTLHVFDNTAFGPFVLIPGSDGNLYGTTLGGGALSGGTIFKITPAGILTTVHSFVPHFYYYFGGLTQGTNGRFYGTTFSGGSLDDGTIYNLSMGLRPFVKVQPSVGAAGATVSILGSDLEGLSRITFNGIPATSFQIVSPTLVLAVVPPGVKSGWVEVMVSNHTLRSNVPFYVKP